MDKKILIIEDVETDAMIAKRILEEAGFQVEVASSGEDGIDTACRICPDLILLDIGLPGIDGHEVSSCLNKCTELGQTKVMMLSGRDNLEDITKTFHTKADDYILKSRMSEILLEKVKLCLGIK